MAKYNIGDKVKVANLDEYDKAFRPQLKNGTVGEIVEIDAFDNDLYRIKVGDTTYAVFDDQLVKPTDED